MNIGPSAPGFGSPLRQRWTARSRALTLLAVAMLVPLTTCWLSWHYEKAGFPIKPRDFILVMGAMLMAFILLNRPSYCWPALLPMALLLVRILDAVVLERYSVVALGTHQIYIMTMLAGFFVALLFTLIPSTGHGIETTRWLAVAIILGCVAANLYEWLGFNSFTLIPGRMSGFLQDPNTSPIIICLLLGVLFTVNPNFWWNLAGVGIAAVGIAVTLSRSGMAVFAAMVLPYVAIHFRERARGLLIIAAIAVPLAGVGLTLLAQSSKTGVTANEDVGSRLRAIYDLDFEKIKSPERAKDLEDGWEAVNRAILFGHGTGAGANQWRPHNQIVALWLDIGIFGVMFFAGFLFTLVVVSMRQRFRGFFCLIPVLLFIPCSQVLIEAPVYWFTISVACHTLFPQRIVFRLLAPARGNSPPAPPSLQSAAR